MLKNITAKKYIDHAFSNYIPVDSVNPELSIMIKSLLNVCRTNGLEVFVVSAFRSFEEQNNIYAKGRTSKGPKVTNARGGQSWHNYGLAVDLAFHTKIERWDELGRYGKCLGLEWGGDWRMRDCPHFQLTKGLTIKQARILHNKGGILAVWDEIKKRKI